MTTLNGLADAVTRVRTAWEARLMSPIAIQQAVGLRDPGAKGPVWISRVSLPGPPEDDARKVMFDAINLLKSDEVVAQLARR